MKNLRLNSSNVFEEKSKEFYESKLSERLSKKFTPKPFEVRFKGVYTISLFTSYLCNLFSILTASSFVFTYLFAVVSELPYPLLISVILTGSLLIIIEALQRDLSPLLFRNTLQYGFKKGSLILVFFILSLSSISIYFSYSGGYDLPELLSTPPTYSSPTLSNIDNIKSEYRELIVEAGKDAKEYKKRKLYRGRLSDKHAKVYKELLDKKSALQNAMLAKVDSSEELNRADIEKAKSTHKKALEKHSKGNGKKGGGLALFSIIAQLAFFLSVFFLEFYDYKTASQYAILERSSSSPDIDLQNKYRPTQLNTPEALNSSSPTTLPLKKQDGKQVEKRLPIGFKTDYSKQGVSELKQRGQGKTKTVYKDRHTIDHNGKRYTLKGVNNFIGIYSKRVDLAETKGKEALAKTRLETLNYWKGRKTELLAKLS